LASEFVVTPADSDCQADADVGGHALATIRQLNSSSRVRNIDDSLPDQPLVQVAEHLFASLHVSAIALVRIAWQAGRDCVE
jgi:hypothetical protein